MNLPSSQSHLCSQMLGLMRVRGEQELYILGSFARHVTLYSQQVRAINLAVSLFEEGRATSSSSIIVIGAGAAGLTAAAAIARLGAQVKVLEKLPRPIAFQRNSNHRYIHPHIDEWPWRSIDDVNAELPILSWSAAPASEVARQIELEWDEECERAKGRISLVCRAQRIRITETSIDQKVEVTWDEEDYGSQRGLFDIAILAVGFGVEDNESHLVRRYWEEDSLDTIDGKMIRCLVSGAGDGGLTDLMRLCLRDFRHDQVIRAFASAENADVIRSFFESTRNAIAGGAGTDAIVSKFQRLKIDSIVESIRSGKLLRNDREVFLTSRSFADVYGPRSFLINRFIVSQLARANAWVWEPGPFHYCERDKQRRRLTVTIGPDQRQIEYDLVVLRHGPRPALELDFGDVWRRTAELRERWESASSETDISRRLLGCQSLFDSTVLLPPEPRAMSHTTPPNAVPWRAKLVVFDLDGTLIQGNDFVWSWLAVWKFLGIPDEVHSNVMNKYLDLRDRGVFNWYSRWCEETAKYFRQYKLHREHLREVAKDLHVVEGFEHTLAQLRKHDVRTAVVSCGFDCMLQDLVPHYQEVFDGVYINHLKFDNAGLFERIDPTPYDFKEKLSAIRLLCGRHKISLSDAVFVGDGFNDEPLLRDVQVISFNASTTRMKVGAQVSLSGESLSRILPICLPGVS